jgi:membrane-associated protease RseP (regulator of RpoE activity)
VNGFGVFLFFLYPGAFADFKDDLTELPPKQQLRVYCAGSWHNTVLSIVAVLLLFSLPTAMSPFYSQGKGVIVTTVAEVQIFTHKHHQSPQKGSIFESHILPGDVITAIGDCKGE